MLMHTLTYLIVGLEAANTNHLYQPCGDTKIQRSDGFTFGIAFSSKDSFFYNQSHQLSPCDRRLSLASSSNSQLALFRPKVDEISLLTINTSNFFPVLSYSFFHFSFPSTGCKFCWHLWHFLMLFLLLRKNGKKGYFYCYIWISSVEKYELQLEYRYWVFCWYIIRRW